MTQSDPGGALTASGRDTRLYVNDGAYDRAGNLVRTDVSSADGARGYDLVNSNAGAT